MSVDGFSSPDWWLDKRSPLSDKVPTDLSATVRETQISPLIFTANIPYEILAQLEQYLAVVTIEPISNLRSY